MNLEGPILVLMVHMMFGNSHLVESPSGVHKDETIIPDRIKETRVEDD